MVRILSFLPLGASIGVLIFQMFSFTTTTEQVMGSIAGIAAYGFVARVARRPSASMGWSFAGVVVIGVFLGLLPPRLRLGGDVDAFVLFYPVVHAALLTGFLTLYRCRFASKR
ncbi:MULTISPECIES: hypothetical protein [Rhodanobacteraceae]|uniref:hypothetical protein n=1 Tax=Rhodanobacteraceae TaxID=1775411 RepID=UPI00056D74AD|nr:MULTISPECIES: hypothetical protein [Rhodanobacteraceae]MDR6644056.1 hypothetical protein [Luteibacter sp. 1214]SDF21294.1 hypothetical protein SAMN04515659_0402 [Dyella sp. 333MFSha]SKC03185.1 hypothetical protein SAMN05660880_03844 [Luteibacter sp. 22Crub2.1]